MNNNSYNNKIIGLGVYTLQEAALYSRVSSNRLASWLYGSHPVIKAQLYQEHLVSFLDLIQAKAINNARALGISMQKIRQAIEVVRKYGIDFPLANRYAIVEFDKELHIQDHTTNELTQATGEQRHQRLMSNIVSQFLRDLEFNAEGVVTKYTPFENNGIKITLNPKVQFGQPLVGNTGYRADILNKAYMAEDSYKSVADEFAVEIDDVKTAVLYMVSLREAA
jgi:uncharacterized protein (DUF433 family)